MPRAKQKTPTSPVPLKVPPHSLEAEQAILGGILINNDALHQVVEILAPTDFYRDAHAAIFEGMQSLFEQSEPIDIVTLSNALSQQGTLAHCGGVEYLATLLENVSTSAGIAYHAEIVKHHAVRRQLVSQCAVISESCFEESSRTEELLELAEQSIFDIAQAQIRQGFRSLKDIISGSFKKLEQASSTEGFITGVTTGFLDFDRLTTGLQPSDLIILAARPSMGKTALALNIGYNAALKTGKAVAIFSLEMSEAQLGIRLLGFDAGVDATKLRTGFLKDAEWRLLLDAANRLSELPIFIDDSSAIGVLEMKAKCRRLAKKRELGLVVIDYLQLIQGRRSAESRQLEISEVSRALKALAKDLNVPVLALSQLNRKVEDRPQKKPQLSDLRESGAIEQDADVIAFIYRDEVYHGTTEENRNIAEITVAKQRNGPTGFFKLKFRKELTRFDDHTERDVAETNASAYPGLSEP